MSETTSKAVEPIAGLGAALTVAVANVLHDHPRDADAENLIRCTAQVLAERSNLLSALQWMLLGHDAGSMSPQIIEKARAALAAAKGDAS